MMFCSHQKGRWTVWCIGSVTVMGSDILFRMAWVSAYWWVACLQWSCHISERNCITHRSFFHCSYIFREPHTVHIRLVNAQYTLFIAFKIIMTAPLESSLIQHLLPTIIKENIEVATFFALLSYVLFLVNWLVTTDWIDKLHLFSGATCAIGVFYLHYSEVVFLASYEAPFVTLWLMMLWYHYSTWRNNYQRVCEELDRSTVAASMRPFQGSIFRFFIVVPVTKNASNQWNAPPFKNTIHVVLIAGYSFLLGLHIIPYFTPLHCLTSDTGGHLPLLRKLSLTVTTSPQASSMLCCRYNYAMSGFDAHEVQRNYCSGRVRIAFAGSWSTGKTYLIGGLLGHNYSTAQSAPAPTTDKFVCIVAGAPYNDPIRSDDYQQRKNCEIIEHVNDVVRSTCGGESMANTLDVADTNTEFSNFVLIDMPGWQSEYGSECTYRTFFHQLIDKVDFTYVVWWVIHWIWYCFVPYANLSYPLAYHIFKGMWTMARSKTTLQTCSETRPEEQTTNWFTIVIAEIPSTCPFSINNTQRWVQDKKYWVRCTRRRFTRTTQWTMLYLRMIFCIYEVRWRASIRQYTTIAKRWWRRTWFVIGTKLVDWAHWEDWKFVTDWFRKTWTYMSSQRLIIWGGWGLSCRVQSCCILHMCFVL